MNLVFEKEQCCGCMACEKICPVKAIKLEKDEEGFWYPNINKEKCINCGACKRVCAFNKEKSSKEENEETVYAVKNKDEEVRKKSTSGGVFNSIAVYVIQNSGVVYGASMNKNLEVKHARTSKKEELEQFYGSKYVQSNIEEVYEQILEDLKENRQVLFSGTPCQVSAIKEYVATKNVNSKNLITCDFVCHRSTNK